MQATTAQTEKILLDGIKALRSHPEKYRAVQRALKEAKTDEDRVRQLLHFATSDRELAALMPAQATDVTEPAIWTTVTVTTVFIAESAY